MAIPLQITFQEMEPSPAVEQRIREKVQKLERFSDKVTSCNVVVQAPHRHSHKGSIFEVRIDMVVPGGEIVVSREPGLNHAHEDVYVAIRDAFAKATRQLEDHVRKRRGRVKTHEPPAHARVARLPEYEDYGFIETPDGLEIYFHRNALTNGSFDSLGVGDEVRFVLAEGEGEKGPQASTVTPVGKHHIAG